MWTLDEKTNTYSTTTSTKNKSWTWCEISAEALKYMRKKDKNVPSFVRLISKNTSVTNMSSDDIRYGRQLYLLTRTVYDELKKDSSKNINHLLDKVYTESIEKSTSKKKKKSKDNHHHNRFGNNDENTDHDHHKHHTDDEFRILEKHIDRLEHKIDEHDVQTALIKKIKICTKSIQSLRKNMRKIIHNRVKYHHEALKEEYNKVIAFEATHDPKKLNETTNDPWNMNITTNNKETVNGWTSPTMIQATTPPTPFVTGTIVTPTAPFVTSPVMTPVQPLLTGTTMSPFSTVNLQSPIATDTTSTNLASLFDTPKLESVVSTDALHFDLNDKDDLNIFDEHDIRSIEEAIKKAESDKSKQQTESDKPQQNVHFGAGELFSSKRPELTLGPVTLNGTNGDTTSVLSFLYNLLQNAVPQTKKTTSDPNTKEEVVGECTLNANLLELQKTKPEDHRSCMININIPIIPQNQTPIKEPPSPHRVGNMWDVRNRPSFHRHNEDIEPEHVSSKHHHDKSPTKLFGQEKSLDTCFGKDSDEAYGFTNSATFFDDLSTTCVKK